MQAQQMVNLTPHALTFVTSAGAINVPPSGQMSRARYEAAHVTDVAGIPAYRNLLSTPDGLPPPQDGVIYVVSAMVQQALRANGIERHDVFSPGTGQNDGPVRDPQGRIVAVTRLVQLP
ncbi:hypothetical protein VPH49_21875 [Pseudomonas luteola]|uniref:hypothetical protein n=1 Tax=Pseudomonas luteola TaxID=47886 RepID=UPI003A896F3B